MVKFGSLKEAISDNLRDGEVIAMEGFIHLQPVMKSFASRKRTCP